MNIVYLQHNEVCMMSQYKLNLFQSFWNFTFFALDWFKSLREL